MCGDPGPQGEPGPPGMPDTINPCDIILVNCDYTRRNIDPTPGIYLTGEAYEKFVELMKQRRCPYRGTLQQIATDLGDIIVRNLGVEFESYTFEDA